MSAAAVQEVVRELIVGVARIKVLYEEHIAYHDGQFLPHVFFGYVTQAVEELFASGDSRERADAIWVLGVLERGLVSGDEDIAELVSVSFLENLDTRNQKYQELRREMGPRLREELVQYESE